MSGARAKTNSRRDNNVVEKPALQKHVEFFDVNHDGVITVDETFRGLRSLGWGPIFGLVSVLIIHLPFSYPSLPATPLDDQRGFLKYILSIPAFFWSYVPDPFLRIHIANIHRDKHGSDSGSFNHRGGFDRTSFNEIFTNAAPPAHDSLSFWEGVNLIKRNHDLFDIFGTLAAVFEWFAVYFMLWPADGRCSKEDIKGVMDGSIFESIAGRRKAGEGKK
ncbi:hypothetical protein BS47DRAFT_1333584 [Hydnum rufescens UP504]|uniref:EF-hand domain-containing protein n=1 Tax=Hydnum rufescens UP504 TaxID=1448309 RepID=A0A9P6AJI1_9AGAM|nr:hypothetical protein BS47DRAFT_1333584 [Hydnum rufescens UP504]